MWTSSLIQKELVNREREKKRKKWDNLRIERKLILQIKYTYNKN